MASEPGGAVVMTKNDYQMVFKFSTLHFYHFSISFIGTLTANPPGHEQNRPSLIALIAGLSLAALLSERKSSRGRAGKSQGGSGGAAFQGTLG